LFDNLGFKIVKVIESVLKLFLCEPAFAGWSWSVFHTSAQRTQRIITTLWSLRSLWFISPYRFYFPL